MWGGVALPNFRRHDEFTRTIFQPVCWPATRPWDIYGAWAEGRAKAYGVTVAELPAFYAKRTLLNEVILPEDIANACFAVTGGLLNKSTGNVLNVDGGVANAFVR